MLVDAIEHRKSDAAIRHARLVDIMIHNRVSLYIHEVPEFSILLPVTCRSGGSLRAGLPVIHAAP
jgi:hypothetical protein